MFRPTTGENRGKPWTRFRQSATLNIPEQNRKSSTNFGADPSITLLKVVVLTYRGLAVDLQPGDKPPKVTVRLGYDYGKKQVVEMNMDGDTKVEFKLP